jgi:5,10-methylenetetrahydromethanopterin reductase
MAEVWTLGVAAPARVAAYAARVEADGFSGLAVVDSQNLSGDPYVTLALAAAATSRLGLATGVTNPYTRHPAATASSIASVQAVSAGRAVLGIGRGDSALAHLGLAPAPMAHFARYLDRLQGYLRGDEVPFDDVAEAGDVASVDALGLGDQPRASRIQWIGGLPKVPVDVAATGPKVIALGALVAERVTFALGADVERIRWGLEVARTTRAAAGLDPDGVSFGAYVNVAVHPDRAVARRLVSGGLSTLARFNVMHGSTAGPHDDGARAVLAELHERYDMNHHTQSGSVQAGVLSDDFIDRYAVVGDPATVIGRFHELSALGLDRFVIMGQGRAPGLDDEARVAQKLLGREVLPAVI